MSSLGKIFLYAAVAGALAAVVGAWLLVSKYQTTKSNLDQVQQSVDVVKKEAAMAKAEKDAALKDKDAATKELEANKSNMDDMTAKLTAAEKAQGDLQASVKQANDALDKANQDLKHVTEVLGMSPDEAKVAIQKAQSEKAAAETEQKILADQLQAATKQVADMTDAINRTNDHGKMPPGISGRVTYVNRAWNFVVLDVGLANGVVPNGELIIYRGNNFLGKVKVTKVEPNDAVADILPSSKGDIQIGDYVLN